jgi:protein-disulfide isomerase
MNKRFLLILAAIIVVVVGFFVLTSPDSSSDSNTQPSNHTYGNGSTGVVLIEYGDFQCPACGSFYPIVKSVKETYKDHITFQFRHFPLDQIHPNARAAHRAAEAAGRQGKFWEMHDMLYDNQRSWTSSTNAPPIFEGYAQTLGLNMDQYRTDVSSNEVNSVINADVREAQKLNATSTPTFVLDGKIIDNPEGYEAFTKLIDDAIRAKGGTPPASATTPSEASGTPQSATPVPAQ